MRYSTKFLKTSVLVFPVVVECCEKKMVWVCQVFVGKYNKKIILGFPCAATGYGRKMGFNCVKVF